VPSNRGLYYRDTKPIPSSAIKERRHLLLYSSWPQNKGGVERFKVLYMRSSKKRKKTTGEGDKEIRRVSRSLGMEGGSKKQIGLRSLEVFKVLGEYHSTYLKGRGDRIFQSVRGNRAPARKKSGIRNHVGEWRHHEPSPSSGIRQKGSLLKRSKVKLGGELYKKNGHHDGVDKK